MTFPQGSVWYPDGLNKFGARVDIPNYNPVTNEYTLTHVVDREKLSARWYSSERDNKYSVGVYDALLKTEPDYSVFVRIPKVGERDDTGGFLSINWTDVSSVTDGVYIKSHRQVFEGVLKKKEQALKKYANEFDEFDGGGKKRSSRTRTTRKSRKRSVRRRRRTNRRHRRNVKK